MRITTLWNIWLDRNVATRHNKGSKQRTKARIWVPDARAYLRNVWSKQKDKIKSGSITEDKAKEKFLFDYGSHAKVYNFDTASLAICRMPPEPD